MMNKKKKLWKGSVNVCRKKRSHHTVICENYDYKIVVLIMNVN
jgi:hypothetical protein